MVGSSTALPPKCLSHFVGYEYMFSISCDFEISRDLVWRYPLFFYFFIYVFDIGLTVCCLIGYNNFLIDHVMRCGYLHCARSLCVHNTFRPRRNGRPFLQTFSIAYSRMKMLAFWFKFHWILNQASIGSDNNGFRRKGDKLFERMMGQSYNTHLFECSFRTYRQTSNIRHTLLCN